MVGERMELVAQQCFRDEMDPYERLLGDAMKGDATLFAREDGVEAAWRVVQPFLKPRQRYMSTSRIPGARAKRIDSSRAVGTTRRGPHDSSPSVL